MLGQSEEVALNCQPNLEGNAVILSSDGIASLANTSNFQATFVPTQSSVNSQPNQNVQIIPIAQPQIVVQPLVLQQQPILVSIPPQILNQQPPQPEDPELTISQLDALTKASDGVDLDEIRDLIRAFKEKRVALGLTQTQVGLDLEASGTGSVPYSQSYICRIEKLDITPRQALQLKPILTVKSHYYQI